MEDKTLHHKKVAILSRLIKESSLTLEEALLLLKTEDVQESVHNPVQPSWFGGTTTPYTIPLTHPVTHGTGVTTISSANSTGVVLNTTGSTSFTFTEGLSNATFTADLNN